VDPYIQSLIKFPIPLAIKIRKKQPNQNRHMKKILLTVVAALGISAGANAQGTFVFNNFTSGAITGPGGVGYAGATFDVSFYWVAGAFAGTSDQLIASGTLYTGTAIDMIGAGPQIEADQSNGAGFFDGGAPVVAGTSAGAYTLVVVAYEGANYADSQYRGASAPVQVAFVTGATPPNTIAVPTFSVAPVSVVPEPSTFALAGLGLASLVIFRRRK
jgi:hypothetical protein